MTITTSQESIKPKQPCLVDQERRIAARKRNRQHAVESAVNNPRGWVTAEVASMISGVALGTMGNWRSADLKAGRQGPAPGSNQLYYRRFGGSVRYFIGPDGQPATEAPAIAPKQV
jgi:hypothetical protein